MTVRRAMESAAVPPGVERRCRRQDTLACVGLAAAWRRRPRANLLAALADRLGHE